MSFSMLRMNITSFILVFMSTFSGCTVARTPIPATGSVATTPLPTKALWTLYNSPDHSFSIEYPTNWHVETPSYLTSGDGAIWSFTGVLSQDAITSTVTIGRQIMPIPAQQSLADWVSLYGRGELTKEILEQRAFQVNGQEAYFLKDTTTFQGISQTTYIRCKTEVWFISHLTDKPALPQEVDEIYSHMANSFMLPCS